jgi:ABC-type amino acid transport substrate-binding protein
MMIFIYQRGEGTMGNMHALVSRLLLWVLALIPYLTTFATAVHPAQARSLEDIKQSGEIRICAALPGPAIGTVEPPDCRGECIVKGPARDLTEAFAQSLGANIKATYWVLAWDEQFHNQTGETVREASYTPALLASGACDVYPNGMVLVEWRLKKLGMVALYPAREMVIIHKSKKDQIRTPADLAGKVAGVTKSASSHVYLEEQNKTVYMDNPIRFDFRPSQTLRLEAVDNGEVDFAIAGSEDALWETRHHLKNSVAAFVVGPVVKVGWGLRQDDKDLQAAVEQFFEAQKASEDSVLNQVWKKTFGLSFANYLRLIAVK